MPTDKHPTITMPLVLATRNEGKIVEFRKLLSNFGIEILSLKDFGPIPDVEEDGQTFQDNAYKKAHFTAKALGYPAIADDSGLMVTALDGRPGVRSARYAGDGASDKERNLKLLTEMNGLADREACFVCVIAIAVPNGPALFYEGRCKGVITEAMIGSQGFGFDPIFYHPPSAKTFAQMTTEEKNRISHRGKAMVQLRDDFDDILIWLGKKMK